jgi:hypothetical protein
MRLPEIQQEDGSWIVDQEKTDAMLRHAYDLGVNYFDTALYYCHENSEIAVGKALKPIRDKVYISTKCPLERVNKPEDFRKTLELMSSYGLDGVVFNQSRSCFYQFAAMKNIPAGMVPCLLLNKADAKQEKLIAEMLKNPAGIKINGKPLILSYWTSRRNSPEQLKRKLAYLRSKYGDFLFVPDVCSLGNKWGRKFRNRELRESDHAEARELIRSYLRVADGVYFGELNSLAKVADSEFVFDADTYRDFILKTIVAVLNEPEFKGKKLFGAASGPGHSNSYTRGNSVSSSGTAALRKSLQAVLAYNPERMLKLSIFAVSRKSGLLFCKR